jgi:hypothetical protein
MEQGRGSARSLSRARFGAVALVALGAVLLAGCVKPAPPPPPPPNPVPVEHYTLTPNPVAFGDVSGSHPPATPPEILVTVKNDGTLPGSGTPLVFGDAHFSIDTASPQFTCGAASGPVINWTNIQPGQSCAVPVELDLQAAPFSVGPISAEVRAFGQAPGPSQPRPGPFTTEITANITP